MTPEDFLLDLAHTMVDLENEYDDGPLMATQAILTAIKNSDNPVSYDAIRYFAQAYQAIVMSHAYNELFEDIIAGNFTTEDIARMAGGEDE